MLLTSRSGRTTLGWLTVALLASAGTAFGQTSRPAPEILSYTPSEVATASARPRAVTPLSPRACGTAAAAAADLELVDGTLARWRDVRVQGSMCGTIRVALHVITAHGEGDVADARLRDLVQALDLGYAGSGWRFELASVDRTEQPAWLGMTPGSPKERSAKQALAIDPARRLNIYVCGLGSGMRGWAQYPWSAAEGETSHGVVLDAGVVAGEAGASVALHEVGHYLGLLDALESQAETVAPDAGRMREVLSVYRPSLFTSPPAPRAPGTTEIVAGTGSEPEDGRVLSYRGAIPNPFHAETALRFTLPSSQQVSLRIYSVTGQLVRTLVDATLPPGDHSAMFRAGDLPSGAYFAVLRAGSVQMTRTLMLVR